MENAAIFASYDVNVETRAELARLRAAAEKGDAAALTELEHCMNSRLEFGTAGLRGEMGVGFARMNDVTVIQAAQGLAHYLSTELEALAETGGVVIGYDHRARGSLCSHRFALLTAAALTVRKIRVHLYRGLVCTPLVPFGILHFKAAAGVMVTASHNPKRDNGYKVYGSNGSQIISPVDKQIAAAILANATPWPEAAPLYETLDCAALETALRASPLVSDPTDAAEAAYFAAISQQLCHHRELNAAEGGSPVKIAYTAMHGVGTPFAERSFAAFGLPPFVHTQEQCSPDPEFPTVAFPNPEEGKGALALAMATADRAGATLIIANDPDADRMAVAEKAPAAAGGQWRVFSGNETGILLAHWLWAKHEEAAAARGASEGSCRAPPPRMIASTVSSKMLASMAAVEGFTFQETLTGFKWMGNAMADAQARGENVLFAFEEAIGFCCGSVVRDKDGVCAAAVFAEMAQALRRRGLSITDHLDALYEKYGWFASANFYVFVDAPTKMTAIFERLRNEGHFWARLGDLRITSIRDLTASPTLPGGWDSDEPSGRPTLPVSKGSQMITFKLSNTVVFTLRGSGTEPKLKCYCEIRGTSAGQARDEVDRTAQLVLDEMIRPETHGLARPTGMPARAGSV